MMKNCIHFIGISFLLFLTSSSILAQVIIIEDDIESYVADSLIGPQSPLWTTWSGIDGGADDAPVRTAFAASGTQSVGFETPSRDALFLLGDSTSGVYTLSFKMYIPAGKQGYYNIQRYETPNIEWAHEIYFYSSGTGSLSAGVADVTTFSFAHDTWLDIVQEIDMDADITELKINGLSIFTWPFSYTSLSTLGAISLGSLDFFTVDTTYRYYIDDLKLEAILPPPPPGPDSVSVTISVDAFELAAVSGDGLHIAGSFQGWDPAASPMTDNGDSTWSISFMVEELDTIQYKFINGMTWAEEESVPMECGVVNGVGGYNREFIATTDSLQSTALVCFSSCDTCDRTPPVISMGLTDLLAEELVVYPNPANNFVGVTLNDFAGEALLTVNGFDGQLIWQEKVYAGTNKLVDCSNWATGQYIIRLETDAGIRRGSFQLTR